MRGVRNALIFVYEILEISISEINFSGFLTELYEISSAFRTPRRNGRSIIIIVTSYFCINLVAIVLGETEGFFLKWKNEPNFVSQ